MARLTRSDVMSPAAAMLLMSSELELPEQAHAMVVKRLLRLRRLRCGVVKLRAKKRERAAVVEWARRIVVAVAAEADCDGGVAIGGE